MTKEARNGKRVVMKPMKNAKGKGLHGIRLCKCGKPWDRDSNAAINIAKRFYVHQVCKNDVPSHLQRETSQQ